MFAPLSFQSSKYGLITDQSQTGLVDFVVVLKCRFGKYRCGSETPDQIFASPAFVQSDPQRYGQISRLFPAL